MNLSFVPLEEDLVNLDNYLLSFGDYVVVIKVDTLAVREQCIFDRGEEKVLANYVNRSREDSLLGIDHLLIHVCDYHVWERCPDRYCPLNILIKKPFVALAALDIGDSDGEHHNSPIIIDRREVDLKQAILVLSFPACANKQCIWITLDT